MAKIVQFRGQAPQGWSKDRWLWAKALAADGSLSAFARLLGYTLAIGYANAETAECRPSVSTLIKTLASSRSTVQRALSDLEGAGWIARLGGQSPTTAARYRFELGNLYPTSRAARLQKPVPELTQEPVSELGVTCVSFENPPIPPYKDKPKLKQNSPARGTSLSPRQLLRGKSRPSPHLSVIVADGSEEEGAWEVWLDANGFPPLGRIGKRVDHGMITGWEMISNRPPRDPEGFAWGLAMRFAEWLADRGQA